MAKPDSASMFVKVPLELLRIPAAQLSPWARLLYARLAFYAGSHGKCNPSLETLGNELAGLTERHIRRLLIELRELTLVHWRRTRTSSDYAITDIREWTRLSTLTDVSLAKTGQVEPVSPDKMVQSRADRVVRQKDVLEKMSLKICTEDTRELVVSDDEELEDYWCDCENDDCDRCFAQAYTSHTQLCPCAECRSLWEETEDSSMLADTDGDGG